MDKPALAPVQLNHGQRKTVEQYWGAERIDWVERQCELAVMAGPSPIKETREARRDLMREASRLSKLIEAAIDQFDTLDATTGNAADVLANCKARAGDIRGRLTQSRDFAWQLENELKWLGADRKPEERSTLLIRQIAKALESDGCEINALQSGPLYQISGLALGLVGLEAKDLKRTLKQVLDRMNSDRS